jgi:hypothetical protein
VSFAEALLAAGDLERARFELESATLCRGEPAERAEAHARLAEVLMKQNRRKEAALQSKRASELDPTNARAKKLKF